MKEDTEITKLLYQDLDKEIRWARLPGKILRIGALALFVAGLLVLIIGVPLRFFLQNKRTIEKITWENKKLIGDYEKRLEEKNADVYLLEITLGEWAA